MKCILMFLLACCLESCARLDYGNFTQASAGVFDLMAKDTAAQLSHVYPPAKNRFHISQKINDPFGIRLIKILRQKGFGIVEKTNAPSEANFFYVVDEPVSHHLYRVSVYVGGQSLSRAYGIQNGVLVPVSAWSHRE